MGLFSKFSHQSKAKAIAKKYDLTYELPEMGVEDINQMALSERGNVEKFCDLLLYNYYKNPCAYTANNVMAMYVDVFCGLKAEVPGYEFFTSVGRFLEQASQVEEIFESKEYYLNLASYELIADKCDYKKAFDVLVGIKPEFADSDVHYFTGCLYYMLDMYDMAKKVLEVSLFDMSEEQRASANGVLALVYQKEKNDKEAIKYAIDGLKSTIPAVLYACCKVLNDNEKYSIVADVLNENICSDTKDVRLFYEWIFALKKCAKSTDVCVEKVEEDLLFERVKALAEEGNRVDVSEYIRSVNQEIMDEIVGSELYEYADDTTKRMLNNQILSLTTAGDDYSMRDFVVFKPHYLN